MLNFNCFLIEKNKALVKKIINLHKLINILQNVINDLMKNIFTAYENLVISILILSIIINFSDDENMYDDINDEDTTDEESDD